MFKRWTKVHVFCFRNCRKSFNFLSRFSSPFCTTYFSSQKQQQVCPVLMRHQVAGLVADLAENSSVVPALKAWKSDRTMVAVVPLLLGLFCDEEVRLGYDRPESGGAIANLWAPLRRHAEAAIAQGDAASASAAATGGGMAMEILLRLRIRPAAQVRRSPLQGWRLPCSSRRRPRPSEP